MINVNINVETQLLTIKEETNLTIVELAETQESIDRDAFLSELRIVADYLEDESISNVVVFKGLCLEMTGDTEVPSSDFFRRWEKVLNQLEKLPKVLIAVLDGTCENFLMQLALCCDYRVATENTTFISSEIKVGYLPGISTLYLTKYVGMGLARRTILAGIPLKADKAYAEGLIDEMCTKEQLNEKVYEFIKLVTPKSIKAFQLGARLLRESYANSYETALGHYLAAQNKCIDK
ncbi:enoyl-CoA hydratase/isomerase family protein [uncultured Kordia sp.]|uniref:enoyl-CoA hydratase/isomerase family protein n=1 Tax=uncultured Kordia sp. TaxID=507699 RepID=UPI0026399B88|nr:enoyl-CoA hydratase/isomerase family protein [uncultured Kordia sp.]